MMLHGLCALCACVPQVYSDLMTNPLLVPLKVLRGHARSDAAGVLDCVWHPTQPWLVTAGADGKLCLFCN